MLFDSKTKWIFLLVFSAILSFGIMWVWKASKVDIGLDVIQESMDAPTLVWSQDRTFQVRMSPIEERFTFSKRFAVISPLKVDSFPNFPLPVTVKVPNIVSAMSYPEMGWSEYGDLRISQPNYGITKLAWLGGPFQPVPVFLKAPRPAQAEVWTWWSRRIVDLHHPEEETMPAIVEESTLRRYHAQVPRTALRSMRLVSDDGSPLNVARLYIGTVVPILLTSNQTIPSEFVWGVGVPNFRNQWNLPVPIPVWLRWEAGGLSCFLIIFGMGLLLGWIGILLFGWGRRLFMFCTTKEKFQYHLTQYSYSTFFLFALPPLLLQIFMLLCFYPACMSPDSIAQWTQAHDMRFRTHHSVLSTFLIRVITWVWDSPEAVVIFQILILSGLIGYGFSLLWRSGINRIAVVLAFLAVVFFPLNLNYAIVIWKDVPYTLTLAALTLLLMHMCLDVKWRTRRWAWSLLGICLGLTPFFRPNGIAVWLGMVPLLPLAFWSYRRNVVMAFTISVIVICLIQFGLFNLLIIRPGYSRSAYMTTSRLAPLVYQDVPFSQDEYEFLDKVRSLEDRWNYQRNSAGRTIFDPKYNEVFAVENEERYRNFFFSCLRRYPYVFLRGFYEGASSFFSPLPARTKELYVMHWTQLSENGQGLIMQSWFPKIHHGLTAFLKKSEREPFRYFLWRPGFWFVVFLAAAGWLMQRMKDCRFAIVFMPVFLNTLSIVLGAVAQDVRYQFPLFFCLGFLIVYSWIPKYEENSST